MEKEDGKHGWFSLLICQVFTKSRLWTQLTCKGTSLPKLLLKWSDVCPEPWRLCSLPKLPPTTVDCTEVKSWPTSNWAGQSRSPANWDWAKDHLELGGGHHVGSWTSRRAWVQPGQGSKYAKRSRVARPWKQRERQWGRGRESCLRLAGFHRPGQALVGSMRVPHVSPVNFFLNMMWAISILLHQQSLIKFIEPRLLWQLILG